MSIEIRYTKDHEWAKKGDNQASGALIIGITDHAQKSLGDIVYVDLPKVGRSLTQGEVFGVVESIKAVSDLYAPVSGVVTAVNESLVSEPGTLNTDPEGLAWMVQIKPAVETEFSDLLTRAAYDDLVRSL